MFNGVTSNILTRVVQIQVDQYIGTSFTIENNNKQFLISAKHLFEKVGYPKKFKINIYKDKIWKEVSVDIYYHTIQEIDVAVMSLKNDITPRLPIELSTNSVILSQDMFFCGFPFNYKIEHCDKDFNNGFPIPMVKKGTLSGIIDENNISIFLLDGHNNQGFSGGPVIYNILGSNEDKHRICSVISGYKPYKSPVYDKNGNETEFFIKENSGIIISYDIKYVLEIIESI